MIEINMKGSPLITRVRRAFALKMNFERKALTTDVDLIADNTVTRALTCKIVTTKIEVTFAKRKAMKMRTQTINLKSASKNCDLATPPKPLR